MKSGFTLIETLVAITILMISIVGPLTIASKGLLAAIYARDQIVASYLAQDAVEYVKNVRDNNFIQHQSNTSIDWLRGLSGCVETNPCEVDTLGGNPTTPTGISSCSDTESCKLYMRTTSCSTAPCGYSPNTSGGTKTQFSRWFYIVPKSASAQGSGSSAGSNSEATLVVRVWWNNGTVANEVLYENELFNVSLSE